MNLYFPDQCVAKRHRINTERHKLVPLFSFILRFLNINIVPFIHLLIALFLPDILVHTRIHTGTRTHRDERTFMPVLRGYPYKQQIHPLLLSTRLSKENQRAEKASHSEEAHIAFCVRETLHCISISSNCRLSSTSSASIVQSSKR